MTIVAATVTANGGPPSSVLDTAGGKLDIDGFPTVLGDLHIADPNLPTLLDVTVSYPATQAPPDETAIRAALANAIAAVNSANEGDGAGSVSFAQLLAATPLPGVAPGADPLPYASEVRLHARERPEPGPRRAGRRVRARPGGAAGAERRPRRAGRTVGRFESLRDRLPSLYRPDADEAVEPLHPAGGRRPRRGADRRRSGDVLRERPAGGDAARRLRRAGAGHRASGSRPARAPGKRLRARAVSVRGADGARVEAGRRSRPPSTASRRCGIRSSSGASACMLKRRSLLTAWLHGRRERRSSRRTATRPR